MYESFIARGYFRRLPIEKFEPSYLSDIFATGFALQHRSRDCLSLSNTKIKNGGELLAIVAAAENARIFGFKASLCPRKGVNHEA